MSMLGAALWARILLDVSVKAAALVVVAALVTVTMRRVSASHRHFVWSAVLSVLTLLPLGAVALPEWSLPLPGGFDEVAAVSPPATPTPVAPTVMLTSIEPETSPTPGEEGSNPSEGAIGSGGATRVWAGSMLARGMIAIWLAGVGSVLAWHLVGSVAAARQRRRARALVGDTPAGDATLALAREAAEEVGLGRTPLLLISEEVRVPVVSGWIRPSILLPEVVLEWDATALRSVFVHEMAHIRRMDVLTHTLARAACAVHWFNPVVWWAAARLRRERERACDDSVLRSGVGAETYADQLIQVARRSRRAHRVPSVALAMARPSQLEGRVLSILDVHILRGPLTLRSGGLVGSIALMILLVGAPMRFGTIDQRALWRFTPVLHSSSPLMADLIWVHGPSTFMYSGRGHRMRGALEGNVGFSLDSVRIVAMLEGGSLRVEEMDRDVVLEALPGPGGLPDISWAVDGTARPIDDDARQWMARALPGAIRVAQRAELRRLQRALDEDPFQDTERLFVGEFRRLVWPVLRSFFPSENERLGHVADEAGIRLFRSLAIEIGADTVRIGTLDGTLGERVPGLVGEVVGEQGLPPPRNGLRNGWTSALTRVGDDMEVYWTRLNMYLNR